MGILGTNPIEQVERQVAFEKFKIEGYINPDGSSFNPATGMFTPKKEGSIESKPPYKPVSLEAAFNGRQEGYKPFSEAVRIEAEAVKAAGTAEVKAEAVQAKVGLKTDVSLEGLKGEIQGDFTRLLDVVKLEFKKNIVQNNFPLGKDFKADDISDVVRDTIKLQLVGPLKAYLDAAGNEALAEKMKNYLKGTSESITTIDVAGLLSNLYAVSAKSSLNKKIGEMRLGDFAQKVGDVQYAMNYAVSFENDELVSKITSTLTDPDFKAAHDSFLKDNPVPTKESKEVEAADNARLDRAKKFKSSFAGKILGYMGIVTLEDAPRDSDGNVISESKDEKKAREDRNDQKYSDALKGDNFIAKWFIFIFGGGAMLDGGGADVAESIASIDPKFKPMVENLQKMAKGSPLNLEKTAAQLAAPVQEILALDKDKFLSVLADVKNMPEKSFKLKDGFDGVAGQKLVVTLAGDAEMILPKGQKIRVGDKDESASEKDDNGGAKDKIFKNAILNITGSIPAGTMFKGKVQFKQEKIVS